MRVVKINAIWCSGCLVMNKIWKNITKKYEIETLNLDYDMDEEEVSKYNVGDILPVFIFYDDKDKEIDNYKDKIQTYDEYVYSQDDYDSIFGNIVN